MADIVEGRSLGRPYSEVLGIAKALQGISCNKGIPHDTDVVDTSLSMSTERGYRYRHT